MPAFSISYDAENRPAYLYFNPLWDDYNKRLFWAYFKKTGCRNISVTVKGQDYARDVYWNESSRQFGANIYGLAPEFYPKIIYVFQEYVEKIIEELKRFDFLGQVWNDFEDAKGGLNERL